VSALGTRTLPLCLGGNVFGWTVDERAAFGVLDAFVEAGGDLVDTADSYTAWMPGSQGGESEQMIGRWMASRGARDRVVIATKVGQAPGFKGLSAATIRGAAEASLRRLGTDRIDLYYAHIDDRATPLEESLGALDALVREGKVRSVGASNIEASRLAEALAASDAGGLARYAVVQPHYNLVHRHEYEGPLQELCALEGIGCAPYYSLANGFLTGKYRPGRAAEGSPRAPLASTYLDGGGEPLLDLLDELAATHDASPAAVALAWLAAQPTVIAPIASARTPEQLADLLPVARVSLADDELARLRAAAERVSER
jgi:aryl-alcohol dehydrogenase-like predicted oxidoreductase